MLRVCVCRPILALVIRHANRIFSAPYYIVICGQSDSTVFFLRYLTIGTIFEKKIYTYIKRKKCVLIFSKTSD
jgi:hypothetical protein